jgi:hypothetical protein
VGCGSVRSAKPQKAILLPEYPVEGVTFTDGVSLAEAELVGASYFLRVVGSCGMPDKPEDRGDFWRIQLWGGIGGSDYGQLWVAKDGSRVLLQPPPKGFRSSTKALLERQGVAYE